MIRVRRLGDIATHEQALFEAVRTWAELEAERNGGALPMPVTISTLVGDVLVKRIHPQAEEGDGGWET